MNSNRDLLRLFEHRLESAIEGLFGSMFRSRVQPSEIARRLFREMEASRLVGPSTVTVPGHYVVHLPADDYRQLQPAFGVIVPELEQFLADTARERGLRIAGSVSVLLEPDSTQRAGTMRIEAQFVRPEESHAQVADRPERVPALSRSPLMRRMVRVRHGGGEEEEMELVDSEQRIGRADDAHIRLLDPPASRHHARLIWDGEHTIVEDLGSTNGTFVNGRRIVTCRLQPGDVIRIGASLLEYRVVHSV